ncbi:MAG: hypothetical protein AAF585_00880, partial [Verrucomicrobiota bacterium]
ASKLRLDAKLDSLIETGLLMARLDSPNLDPEVYTYQIDQLKTEISEEIGDEKPTPKTVSTAIYNAVYDRGGFQVRRHDDQGSLRVLEDPRRLFEDREGGVIAMQVLAIDLLRSCGLPEAKSTNSPGMILCNPNAEKEEWRFFHSCNGELLNYDYFRRYSCARAFLTDKDDVVLVEDREVMLHWMILQKNQITVEHWPHRILPYLRVLHEAEPDDPHFRAEMVLFQISNGELTLSEGIKLIKVDDLNFDGAGRERMLKVFSFMGFNLSEMMTTMN